jgi:DMSO reductase anchor subunit
MRRRRWTETTPTGRTEGDLEKLKIAVRLQSAKLVPVGWIAQRLHLGTRKRAAVKLHRWAATKQKVEPDQVKAMV